MKTCLTFTYSVLSRVVRASGSEKSRAAGQMSHVMRPVNQRQQQNATSVRALCGKQGNGVRWVHSVKSRTKTEDHNRRATLVLFYIYTIFQNNEFTESIFMKSAACLGFRLYFLQCSVTCGDGLKSRTVQCSNTSSRCDPKTMPTTMESCNTGPCPQWNVGSWSQVQASL